MTVGKIESKEATGKGSSLAQNDYNPEGISEEEAAIHKKLDETVDITKPLIPQVKKMSNREFMAFVRRPRYIDDKDGI
jgi:hypothetical protein